MKTITMQVSDTVYDTLVTSAEVRQVPMHEGDYDWGLFFLVKEASPANTTIESLPLEAVDAPVIEASVQPELIVPTDSLNTDVVDATINPEVV